MAIKKSELYSSLWKSCDELRGGMDASQYKDYVLVLLFMKYVSDKAASRRDYLLDVPPGARFDDMVAAKNQKDIGDRINKIIAKLADANPSLRGAIEVANFNDPDKLGKGQEMVDRLTKLIGIFQNPALDFRSNTAEGDDLLGDAYEYLMRNFATESGKSKGQFYTPAEVSRVMAQVVGVTNATSNQESIYDPTCGSGSLLLKAHAAAKAATGFDLAIYGQEMDNATAALARMNMVLHDAETAEVWQDNTLARPHWTEGPGQLKQFSYVVANPPFSQKAWTTGFDPEHDEFRRFEFGQPPRKNGDYAFLLHMLASLKSTGKAAVVLPHGVLFRGNAEAAVRRELVRRGYIKGIIGLPPNLFYGTGIPACLVVLDKEGASQRPGIFMIDASRGFRKDGAKNRLREQDIHRIVDTFARQADVDQYSRFVPHEEIEANGFNLNLPRYVDSSDPEDVQDIEAHLRGGVPAADIDRLGRYWQAMPALREALFPAELRAGYSALAVPVEGVADQVLGHPDHDRFRTAALEAFEAWVEAARPSLARISSGDRPRDLGRELSESILVAYRSVPVLDPYAIYQRFMDYWSETLQDDAYLLVESGWLAAAKPHLILEEEGQKSKEVPDFQIGRQKFKSELLPARVVIERYCRDELAEVDRLRTEDARVERELDELFEEHGADGGLLEDLGDDKGRISKKTASAGMKELDADTDAGAERAALRAILALHDEQARVRAQLKAGVSALGRSLAKAYAALDDDAARDLAVEGKWIADLRDALREELDATSRALIARVTLLADRYAEPLPDLSARVGALMDVVDKHLSEMGYVW